MPEEKRKIEILNLFLKIPGVNLKASRMLYNLGYRSYEDLSKASEDDLTKQLENNRETALKIKVFIGEQEKRYLDDLEDLEKLATGKDKATAKPQEKTPEKISEKLDADDVFAEILGDAEKKPAKPEVKEEFPKPPPAKTPIKLSSAVEKELGELDTIIGDSKVRTPPKTKLKKDEKLSDELFKELQSLEDEITAVKKSSVLSKSLPDAPRKEEKPTEIQIAREQKAAREPVPAKQEKVPEIKLAKEPEVKKARETEIPIPEETPSAPPAQVPITGIARNGEAGKERGNGYELRTKVRDFDSKDLTSPRRQRKGDGVRSGVIAGTVLIVIVLLLASVILFFTAPKEKTGIKADGDAGDWSGIPKYSKSPAGTSPNVDLASYSAHMENGILSFLMSVSGTALSGAPSPGSGFDTFHMFIDNDRNTQTGYRLGSLGAEYMIQVYGRQSTVEAGSLYRYNSAYDSNGLDWNGWKYIMSVRAGVRGANLEAQLSSSAIGITDGSSAVNVLFHTLGWNGVEDFSDTVISTQPGLLVVTQKSAPNEFFSASPSSQLLSLELKAVNSDISVSRMAFQVTGNASVSNIRYGQHQAVFTGNNAVVDFASPYVIRSGATETGVVYGDLNSAQSMSQVGLKLESVLTDKGAVEIKSELENYAKYLDKSPASISVDGAFGDWKTQDKKRDVVANHDGNVDITNFGIRKEKADIFFYLRVDGEMLGGTKVPWRNGIKIVPPNPPAPNAMPVTGEDYAYVFIDSDNSSATGYVLSGISSDIGADYLINITGKNGNIIHHKLAQFSGAKQSLWSWKSLNDTVLAEKDTRQMEIGIGTAGIGLGGNFSVVFITKDWRGYNDITDKTMMNDKGIINKIFAPEVPFGLPLMIIPALFFVMMVFVKRNSPETGRVRKR